MQRLRIAVVGGGIGGLAAAAALAARGHGVTVHERAAALEEVGAGLQVGPNGVKVLRALGAAEAVLARAARPAAVEMRDGLTGRGIARVALGAEAEARHGAPYVQVHRADLLGALAAAAERAGARLALGSEAGPAAPPGADVIVAADGVRSGFRGALVPGAAPAFTGQVAWRALVPAARVPAAPDPSRTHLFLGPGRHLVLYPLRGGTLWNVVAAADSAEWAAEGWRHAADPAHLRRAFAGWCAPVQAMLASAEDAILWGLFGHGPLPRWQDGRTVLLGDAAHPMLPYLAQGATMALEDAWALAAALDAAPPPAALAAYEAARKPRTARVQRQSRANARIYHLRGRLPRAARNAGLGLASRLAPGGLLARFDWLYGHDVTAG